MNQAEWKQLNESQSRLRQVRNSATCPVACIVRRFIVHTHLPLTTPPHPPIIAIKGSLWWICQDQEDQASRILSQRELHLAKKNKKLCSSQVLRMSLVISLFRGCHGLKNEIKKVKEGYLHEIYHTLLIRFKECSKMSWITLLIILS